MNTLIYLSYGQGPHVCETVFSILSALYQDNGTPTGYQIAVYTDTPQEFSGFGVAIEAITPDQMRSWAGPYNFNHRRKIVALATAMRQSKDSVVLIDSDTYFLRSPRLLFDRIAPGQSLMHISEGQIGYLLAMGPMRSRLPGKSFDLGSGNTYALTANTRMYNAGVIGLHATDAPLLDEVLNLTDMIHSAAPSWCSEQLAFTCVLSRRTCVQTCRDIVFHYTKGLLRDPFRKNLPAWMQQHSNLPLRERAATLYNLRPVTPMNKKIKAALKRTMKPLGLFRHDAETSI